nr:glyoxylate/hydroxypyruvate reductase HPR3-like [Tanacetum cinerariifolium]
MYYYNKKTGRLVPQLNGSRIPSVAAITTAESPTSTSHPSTTCLSRSPITAEVLADLPSLELVVTSTTRANHIDMPECRRRGIRVTNTGKLFSDDVADGAVGLLIDVTRRISSGDRFVRGGLWPMTEVYTLGSKSSSSFSFTTSKDILVTYLSGCGML